MDITRSINQRGKWMIYCDGSCKGNPGPAAGAAILYDPNGDFAYSKATFIGNSTNNMAEYAGVIAGLDIALYRGLTNVDLFSDSQLVVNQINGTFKIKDKKFEPMVNEAREKLMAINGRLIQIPRAENNAADSLAKQAAEHQFNMN